MAKYFVKPFAVSGDVTPIPNLIQPAGTVSYEQGFGADYSLPLGIDPAALPVPRPSFNQLMNDVTTAIQQYQQTGTPAFITAADNLGTPYSYSKWSYASWDAGDGNGVQIYQSTANGNINAPTAGAGASLPNVGWVLRDDTIPSNVLDSVNFAAGVVTGDVVYYNAISGLYDKAIANGTGAQQLIGLADVDRGRIITFGVYNYLSGLVAGSTYYLSNTVYGGLTLSPTGQQVPVGVAVSSSKFMIIPGYGGNFAPSSAGVLTGTIIDYAAPGTPTGYLYCDGSPVSRVTYAALFAVIGTTWGAGDGVNTFNLPDFRRKMSIGDGGAVQPYSALASNALAGSGGYETHAQTEAEMFRHNHPGSTVKVYITGGNFKGAGRGDSIEVNNLTLDMALQGGNQPTSYIPPVNIVRKLIKT